MTRRLILLIPALMVALVLAGCGSSTTPSAPALLSAGPPAEVLVRMGRETVTRADLTRLLAASEDAARPGTAPKRSESSRMAYERFHLGLLEQRAGLREVARQKAPSALAGIAPRARQAVARAAARPSVPKAVALLQAENALLLDAITRAVEGPVMVTQKDVRAYMREYPGEFTGPGAERAAAAQLLEDRTRQARARTANKLNGWLRGKVSRSESVKASVRG